MEYAAASQQSNAGMAILLFLFIYATSVLRARSPAAFPATIVMSLLSFQAVNFSVMNGAASTIPQLLYSMAAFGVGLAICFVINVLFFPTFSDVQWAMRDVLITSEKALKLIVKSYMLEATPEDVLERKRVVSSMRGQIGMVSRALEQSQYEIRYSILTNSELRDNVFGPLRRMATHLSSVETALSSGEIADLSKHPLFKERFSAPLAEPLQKSSRQISIAVEHVSAVIAPDRKRKVDRAQSEPSVLRTSAQAGQSEEVPLNDSTRGEESVVINITEASEESAPKRTFSGAPDEVALCTVVLSEAMTSFEERQLAFMRDLLKSDEQNGNAKVDEMYEQILEVNFFVLALREYVAELRTIHREALTLWMNRKRTLHMPAVFDSWRGISPTRKPKTEEDTNLKSDQTRKAPEPHSSRANQQFNDMPTDSEDGDALEFKQEGSRGPSPSSNGDQTERSETPAPKDSHINDADHQKLKLGLFVIKVLQFLASQQSIYAFKAATCVTIVCFILFYERAFFVAWGLQSTVITIIVTGGPVLGQTYTSFVYNLIGCVVGNLWSFVSFVAWKQVAPLNGQAQVNPYGFSLMVVLLGLVFFHFFLNTKFATLGLLTLLSFAIPAAGQYTSISQPGPLLYFYRQLAAVSMAVTFVLVFNVMIFPNLARVQLRESMSRILGQLQEMHTEMLRLAFSCYYEINQAENQTAQEISAHDDNGHTAHQKQKGDPGSESTTLFEPSPPPPEKRKRAKEETFAKLLDMGRHNSVAIAQLEPLLLYASTEPRLAGPLQISKYREIISGMQSFLDRTGSCLGFIGPHGFSRHVASNSETVRAARREMSGIVGLRLFVYAAALLHRQPLPYYLPRATEARDKLLSLYIKHTRLPILLVSSDVPLLADAETEEQGEDNEIGVTPEPQHHRRTIEEERTAFYSYALALRQLCHDLDRMESPFKKLFGEVGRPFKIVEKPKEE
ncbi:hypothetical protein BJ742DRAFT_805629 [Cladochytrium replicatum]|nr:hypothetical protein BJ742DRAFT_805629 [Cladochytrium replicatum]